MAQKPSLDKLWCVELIRDRFDFISFGPDECMFVYVHFSVCAAEILTVSCPLVPIGKVEGSTGLSPWVSTRPSLVQLLHH